MDALLDVIEAARLLAVSPWTIRAYIRNGKLRPVRIGRLVRLDQEELGQFVANGKADSLTSKNTQQKERENGL